MKKIILLIVLFCSIVSWGQATLPVSRTTWDVSPLGWTDSPLDSYLTTFACSTNNGAKFDTTGDTKIVQFGSAPNQLSFVVKSNSTSSSTLLIEESIDGVSYTTVVSLNGTANLPTTCTTKGPYTLNTSTRFVRWTFTKGTSNLTMDDVIISVQTGPISVTSGDWNVGSTWSTGTVPLDSDNVTISTGHIVHTNTSLTRNGNTQVNGTFELRDGGFASGTGTFTYNNTTGSLNFNTSISYNVDNTHVYWPTTNGPFNVSVLSGGVTLNAGTNRTVNGLFSTAAGITFGSSTLTLNGTCRINGGGFFNNAPIYGASSTLLYNTNGLFNRGIEWIFNGVGIIGTTPGYPNNVQLSNNTTFDYNNGTPLNKATAGNLTIDSGSSFYMDFGGGASGGVLTVAGNITNNGNFTLGNAIGDDLRLNGNFTNNGVFNGNGRAIFFTKNGTQIITSTPLLTIPYVVQQPSSGTNTVQLASNIIISAPAGGNAISFSSANDIFDINSRTLTIGTVGVANTISGLGTFKGSTTSNLILFGNGSVGTLRFTTGSQILGNLTLNRQAGVIGFDLGTDLSINSTLLLTNGIINTTNRTLLITNSGLITGGNASNYIIADYTDGGFLRKNFNAIGTFTFPIGDRVASADGSQYSPITINFTAGTFSSGYVSLNVEDSKEPNNEAPTDYITRYWNLIGSGITNATYNVVGTYLPVDINGTESNYKSGRYATSTWTEGPNVIGGSNTIILTALTTATGALTSENHYTAGSPFKRAEINIQQGATNYLTNSTYNFGTQTVNSTTNVVFTIQNLGLENLNLGAATVVGGGVYSLSINYGSTVLPAGTTTFTITFNPLTTGTFTGSISIPNNDTTDSENPYMINFTGVGQNSILSDIISAGGEVAFVPSIENDATINTTADGIQVWQFTIRDGGASASDLDTFATIVNSLTLTQAAGNQINDWADAIQAVALFNGATKIADGVVTTNQIVFTGAPLISVPDNGSVTLSLRLSVQTSPNNSGSNVDGDDFVFSISNANAIAASSGSQFTSFSTASSTNGQNVLQVIATHLTFIQQPITTGVNSGMTDVIIAGTDVNGNIDLNYSGTISITSTGTMTGSPLTSIASAGLATFSGIIHTTVGTSFTLNATATGLVSNTSELFDITAVTILESGDLAIVAVNTSNGNGDEFAFVCFQDILPGTEFFITDNGYERVSAGLWGDTEGVLKISRIGTTLPKGTIINIISLTAGINNGSDFVIQTCGVIDNNWIKDEITTSPFDLNSDDQIWFIQGGNFINPAGTHNAVFTGNVLYGWTDIPWKTAPGYASTSGSTIFPGLTCFTTDVNNVLSGNSYVKFNDPIDPDFSTTTNAKLDWIALINNSSNWDAYSSNAAYNSGGYDYKGNTICAPIVIDPSGYVNGKWTGRQDTNWFNCGNWDTLRVPDETVNVLVEDTTFNNAAIVDATAPFASTYGNVAKAKDLTITGEKVEITSNINNILEVHGNLIIDGTGVLDMNDGNDLTADGTLHLYGDWSNLVDETAFDQGNGTIHFDGSIPQIITSLDPIGTEIFYNVILNNDFDTTISNDLIAQGDLTVSATKTVTVEPNDYVQVNNKLQLDGDIIIENDGQLIQVNEIDSNDGTYTGTKFQVKRIAQARNLDYVYWSSPVENFDVVNLPNSHRYEWITASPNTNGTQGNWFGASGNMFQGQGYIARASNGSATAINLPITFQGGKPFNGQFNKLISRGSVSGIDDCWNLLGNPYPSAIDADLFLLDNTNIEGSVRIWMHGTLPAVIPSPFYQNFQYNYTEDDYIIYNGTATSIPAVFNGKIASGQGFFVRMLEDGETDVIPPVSDIIPATADVVFKNEYRGDVINGSLLDNTEFYKNSNSVTTIDKSRIWLDLISPNNQLTRTVVGYVPGATLAKDRLYDALIDVDSFKLYSLINSQKQAIQGRPVPFDQNDTVPLGVFIQVSGNYTIAISAVDGLFSDASQNIYLEDKLLNVIHDLKQAPYNFSTIAGEFNNRFVVRYTNTVLSNQNFETANGLIIVSNEKVSLLASQNIKSVLVFDVLGRKIYDKNDINSTEVVLEKLMPTKEAILVKTTLEDGKVVTKKIIY
jgi:hypothetical protein